MGNTNSIIYKRITVIAIASRLAIYAISYLPTLLFERFDKSTSLVLCSPAFRHLLSWDAFHNLGIADRGYTHEHSIPFFPLLPMIIRVLPFADNLAKAIIFNSIITVVSALLIYKIGAMSFSGAVAYRAAIFFLFNPASAVFMSFYTEPLFTLLFLMAYYYIARGRMLRASTIFALCSLTRSNTVILLLFVRSIHIAIVLLPMAMLQLYMLLLIWRRQASFKLLVPYSYTQHLYWDQGFLRFFRPQNIPNMLFGLPAIACGLYVVWRYARSRIRSVPADRRKYDSAGPGKCTAQALRGSLAALVRDPFFTERTSPITKLMMVLAMQLAIIVFFIHWNIAFRFISFNPVIYWSFASFSVKHAGSHAFRAVLACLATYGVLYVVLFGLFYPPA